MPLLRFAFLLLLRFDSFSFRSMKNTCSQLFADSFIVRAQWAAAGILGRLSPEIDYWALESWVTAASLSWSSLLLDSWHGQIDSIRFIPSVGSWEFNFQIGKQFGKVVGSVAFPKRNGADGRLRLECANVAVGSVAFPNRNGTARPA